MTAIDNISDRISRIRACRVSVAQDGGEEGVFSWGVTLPAGAILLNVGAICNAVWNAGTSATLIAGITGDDDDTFFAGVDMKATDLTAGQSISFYAAGGKGGSSYAGTGTHWDDLFRLTEQEILFQLTLAGTECSTGDTVLFVEYAVPVLESATFVPAPEG